MSDLYRPRELRRWTNDIPGGELYVCGIQSDRTIYSAYGRYAHGSGSTSCSWQEFLDGKLNNFILETMGVEVLEEIRAYIAASMQSLERGDRT
jgi:hypothetical protein